MKITARNATLALLVVGTLTLAACASQKPAEEAPAAQAAPADAAAPAADSGTASTP